MPDVGRFHRKYTWKFSIETASKLSRIPIILHNAPHILFSVSWDDSWHGTLDYINLLISSLHDSIDSTGYFRTWRIYDDTTPKIYNFDWWSVYSFCFHLEETNIPSDEQYWVISITKSHKDGCHNTTYLQNLSFAGTHFGAIHIFFCLNESHQVLLGKVGCY